MLELHELAGSTAESSTDGPAHDVLAWIDAPDASEAPDAPGAPAADDAVERLTDVLGRLSAQSGELVDRATTALCLTSVMGTQLGDVSDRAAQMAGRAGEIAERCRASAEATASIRAMVDGAHEAVRLLTEHTRDIERISATLARLAMETRMVGLNAAIEAARAGAAGAGFAVVADKVRELADGAGSASDQIVARLTTIRDSARESARVMEAVGGRIGAIDAHAGEIAAAAGEQADGAREIAGGISQVTTSVDDIVQTIEQMTENGMTLGEVATDGQAALGALGGAERAA